MENKNFILFILTVLISCSSNFIVAQAKTTKANKLELDTLGISFIEISQIKSNKKLSKPKRLNKTQSKLFISTWNNSKTTANCPNGFSYSIAINFQDYTRRLFNLEKSILSENNNYCIETNNKELANLLMKSK
ncbi:MAG: hypothetical protein ABIO44_12430 [Saprospiraceae bacterium]